MHKNIMVAVDLAHLEPLEKSLQTAADLAKYYDATLTYVSIGSTFPTTGHNPHEFDARLQKFAGEQAEKHGIKTNSHAIGSTDPAAELDHLLLQAITDTHSELVVMGSHQPGLAEYFFSSNAGYVASHAKVSVMVVR